MIRPCRTRSSKRDEAKRKATCKIVARGLNYVFRASIFSRAFIIRSASRASFVHHARASAEVAVWEKRSASLRRWYNPARVTSIGIGGDELHSALERDDIMRAGRLSPVWVLPIGIDVYATGLDKQIGLAVAA